jgi:exopolysaccharide biosynthesis predicted pyruvyltransferase EpsI
MGELNSLEEIRAVADGALAPTVAQCDSVALVGFPDHANRGDSAIWLGELAFLKRKSVRIAYSCSRESYRKENLVRHTDGATPILIHGGGFFGDVWSAGLDWMLRVVADFPERSIVVMPQSVYFTSQQQVDRARRVINGHRSMTLCVRDDRSEFLAREYFDHPIVLTPDSAVFLDLDAAPRGEGILCLAREDREASGDRPDSRRTCITKTDWISLPSPAMRARLLPAVLFRSKGILHPQVATSDSAVWQEMAAAAARNGLAKYRLGRGVRLLESAEVIATDRLHGHILSVLLGRPNVLVDNSYGKVRAYYETWSRNLPLVHWASDWEDAIAIAEALAERSR